MALSDTWLKAHQGKARAALEERSDREGLSVRITPKGKITFQLRYRYSGTPKRLDLGSYPLMSLKEARGEALRLRAQHEQGHDPKVVRLLEKQAILKADSVEQLFRQWHEAYCQKNKKGRLEPEEGGSKPPACRVLSWGPLDRYGFRRVEDALAGGRHFLAAGGVSRTTLPSRR